MRLKVEYFFYLFVLLSVFSCKSQHCTPDPNSKVSFFYWIDYIEKSGRGTTIDSLINCYSCIEIISGIKGQGLIREGHPIIVDQAIVKKDIKFWKEWYDANKCEINLTQFDHYYLEYDLELRKLGDISKANLYEDRLAFWRNKCLN